MSAATEKAMGDLHAQVATVLTSVIGNAELCTPAHLSAAIRFLKDNSISCVVDKDTHMGELAEELKNSHPDAVAADAELMAALGDAENVLQFRANG